MPSEFTSTRTNYAVLRDHKQQPLQQNTFFSSMYFRTFSRETAPSSSWILWPKSERGKTVLGGSTYRRMKILKKFNKTSIDLVCPRSARHDHVENWSLRHRRILFDTNHLPYERSCSCLLFQAILRLSARFVFWMQSYIRLHWLLFGKQKYLIFVLASSTTFWGKGKKLCSSSVLSEACM